MQYELAALSQDAINFHVVLISCQALLHLSKCVKVPDAHSF